MHAKLISFKQVGNLIDHWSKMIQDISRQTAEEEYDDHEKRHNRWNRLLKEGVKTALRRRR